MSNFLDQDFGSDDEDEDFNVVAADDSEDEDGSAQQVCGQVSESSSCSCCRCSHLAMF